MNIQETLDYVDKRISPLRSNWMMSPDEKALRLLYAEVIKQKQRAESAEDREASWHENYDHLQGLLIKSEKEVERLQRALSMMQETVPVIAAVDRAMIAEAEYRKQRDRADAAETETFRIKCVLRGDTDALRVVVNESDKHSILQQIQDMPPGNIKHVVHP